jgi:hypothetical protein
MELKQILGKEKIPQEHLFLAQVSTQEEPTTKVTPSQQVA